MSAAGTITAAPRVAVVVLAAGASRRLGRPKQLIDWQGEPLVRRTVRRALESKGEGPWVVLGHRSEEVASALDGLDYERVDNPRWSKGQSTSIGAGVRALPDSIDAAIFLPCDQPFMETRLLDRLITVHGEARAHEAEQKSIVVPVYEGQRGSPVLIGRELFGELRGLEGDQGGRRLFAKHDTHLVELPWPTPHPNQDIDTPQDLQKCQALYGSRP